MYMALSTCIVKGCKGNGENEAGEPKVMRGSSTEFKLFSLSF